MRQTLRPLYNNAASLRASALRRDPNANVATIAWLGYDPLNGLHDAVNRAEAQGGAPLLKKFVQELRDGHEDEPDAPHITVFGHSYGSTVTGMAAWIGDRLPISGPLGRDPMDPDFGARIVPMGADQLGHSDYMEFGSRGVQNLALILLGRGDEIG